ncbi:hypothetical protein PAXRUDRAFT_823743 [Paxillus rubicundulus Ve08.2h10]|uniref:Uncharacterized protein n=1 Tax=Paxillus rubicundulus Ve08.2h10 TaxID=930991 RepID=A0A0D0E8J7_9AGAM|nr:hypothetical protein PAXRUDRAFT_823743 [Paxillus rubicundulus Ve08.2h10]
MLLWSTEWSCGCIRVRGRTIVPQPPCNRQKDQVCLALTLGATSSTTTPHPYIHDEV